MKKLLCIISALGLVWSVVLFPALGYEGGDVVCEVDSLIKGNVSQGSDVTETALGDLTADALRYVSGADAAIVNGGELETNLEAGACTWSDILCVFGENRSIAVAEVTAAQLWAMIEYAAGYTTIGDDERTDYNQSAFAGFPQVSGITFEYDVTAPVGSRVRYLYVGDVSVQADDSATTFRLCATEYMLSGGYGYDAVSYESLDMNLADALAAYLKDGDYTATTISAGRITTLGTNDTPLLARGVVLIIGLFGCMCGFIYNKARKRANPDRSLNGYFDPNPRR